MIPEEIGLRYSCVKASLCRVILTTTLLSRKDLTVAFSDN